MENPEIIDTSVNHECYRCSGTKKENNQTCSTCNGTGTWKEESFILIAKQPDGQKIAFQIDSLGK